MPTAWKLGLVVFGCTLVCVIALGLYFLQVRAPLQYQNLLKAPSQIPKILKQHYRSIGIQKEKLYLDIGHLNMESLNRMRLEALQDPINKNFQTVSATIRQGAWKWAARVRLKGDRPVHYQDPNSWSFRVEIKNDTVYKGMRRFSLHHAGARNYVYEWIFHAMLRHEGLMALRYQFLDLYINGKYVGLYALEEHFDHLMVERHGHRSGPIIHFDEKLDHANLSLSVPRAYGGDYWLATERKKTLERAIALAEGFRSGKMRLHEVMDLETTAQFVAITDLCRMHHATVWKSLRLYYNPITDRLYPIGYDGHLEDQPVHTAMIAPEIPGRQFKDWLYDDNRSWYTHLFHDPQRLDTLFWQSYTMELQQLSRSGYLEHFMDSIRPQLQVQLQKISGAPADHMHHYGPDFFQYDESILFEQRDYIQKLLHPKQPSVYAYRAQDPSSQTVIEAGNLFAYPIIASGFWLDTNFISLEKEVWLPPKLHTDLPYQIPFYQKIAFQTPDDLWHDSLWQHLELEYHLVGGTDPYRCAVFPWQRSNPDLQSVFSSTPTERLPSLAFIEVHEKQKQVLILPGSWILREPLILPQGYSLTISAGTQIRMENQALIGVQGPCLFLGKEAAPIVFSGSGAGSGGIFVIERNEHSRFEHVHFRKLSPPKHGNWELTGAITLYESEATFRNCSWWQCQAEDALNLVRSRFKLVDCQFLSSPNDGLDCDFSEGEIMHSRFSHCGNDGLDVSGGQVDIRFSTFEFIGDKGISAGEAATVLLEDVHVNGAVLGIVSKDLSKINGTEIQLDSCHIGLAAFQKKPEFGGGKIDLKKVQFFRTDSLHLIEVGSEVMLNGQLLKSDQLLLKKRFYTD